MQRLVTVALVLGLTALTFAQPVPAQLPATPPAAAADEVTIEIVADVPAENDDVVTISIDDMDSEDAAVYLDAVAGEEGTEIEVPEDPDAPVEAVNENVLLMWTCTMHPDIQLPEPGQCPECNMDLVLIEVKPTPVEEAPEPEVIPDPVPDAILTRLEALTTPGLMNPAPTSEEEFLKRFAEQQVTALAVANEAILNYPDAENLDYIRNYLVSAALITFRIDASDENETQVREVCTQVVANATTAETRLNADLTLVFMNIQADPEQTEAVVTEMVARYADTDQAGQATLIALMIAGQSPELADLAETFADTLEADYLDQDGVALALFGMGRTVPFQTELTTLDGETVTLPDDLVGNVVIVDVWTSWCTYCNQMRPHLEAMYERHKDDGLVIVGVSMDDTQQEAATHLENESENDWLQTYTGPQPNAFGDKFDVPGYPTLFVIDRNGNFAALNPQDMRHYPNWTKVMEPFEAKIVELLAVEDPTAPIEDDDADAPDEPATPEDLDDTDTDDDATPDVEDAPDAPAVPEVEESPEGATEDAPADEGDTDDGDADVPVVDQAGLDEINEARLDSTNTEIEEVELSEEQVEQLRQQMEELLEQADTNE
jgi:thiol-disulfide isomerase/thioredoxin